MTEIYFSFIIKYITIYFSGYNILFYLDPFFINVIAFHNIAILR